MTPEDFNRPHEFLLTAEAAALLRLSKRTLEKYRMTGIGGPPFVRIGGRVLYRRADLENWLAANLWRSTSEEMAAAR
jgi:excisionase family DNA binding protein